MARPAPGNGNKRQRPNPRPDLKRGRETEGRETGEGAGPSHTELNIRNKTRLDALSRRYPGKLELRAPQGATPITLRMQAQTAARFEDVLAHVTFTGTGGKNSRLVPLWDQTRVWDPRISHPRSGRVPAGAPPTSRLLLAFRADGGVVWPARPPACCATQQPACGMATRRRADTKLKVATGAKQLLRFLIEAFVKFAQT